MTTSIQQQHHKKSDKKRKSASRLSNKRAWIGLAFISPWLIGFILLKFIPIIISLAFSFTNFDMLKPDEIQFVGLENYVNIVQDRNAGFSFFRTFGLALLTMPAQLLAALGLASLFNNSRVFGKTIYRVVVFLPSVIPGVAIGFIFFGFLDPTTGWINRLIMEPLGLPSNLGPGGEAGANFYQMLVAIWSIGPGFLIMLGAMQAIPPEIYEASRVDGAGPLVRLFKITVPMISPSIFFTVVINLIGIFGGAALLDRGSSFRGGGQSPFDFYIYTVMFRQQQLGYAASLAWAMFIAMLIITIALFISTRYWVYYPQED